MADVPFVIRRPMPIKHLTIRRLAEPIPLDFMPELGDGLADLVFFLRIAVEKLARPSGDLA